MGKLLRNLFPSMYQRRLLLLGGLVFTITAGLVLRLGHLTVARGAPLRETAESKLVAQDLIPTRRGRILDRHLRVLAVDRPSFDLVVRYPAIVGNWAFGKAWNVASKDGDWRRLGPDERLERIAAHQERFDAQVEQLWKTLCRIGHIDRRRLGERLQTITRRVQSMVSAVQARRMRRWAADLDEAEVKRHVARPIREQGAFFVVLADIDDAARLLAERLIGEAAAGDTPNVWEAVSVRPSRARSYPRDTLTVEMDREGLPSPVRSEMPKLMKVRGIGIHIIGAMRRSWREQRERRETDPLRLYQPGDLAGEWGLEQSFEPHLRGTRGRIVHHLDSGRRRETKPLPGGDVVSTVDIHLQARIEAVMEPSFGLMKVQPWHTTGPASPMVGTPLRGAAVVLDVAQGQVLAAVSQPGFTRDIWQRNPTSLWKDEVNRPFWNRAVSMSYPPGSTVKPLVLAAAITDGKLGFDESIHCEGHLHADRPEEFRCWIYKMFGSRHEDVSSVEAIGRSCNIFFYTLGMRLGAGRLVAWYEQFGLGRTSRCGLPRESRGHLPDQARAADRGSHDFSVSNSKLLGIGQGPVEMTPLQAASAYAALARGGYWLPPTFIVTPQAVKAQQPAAKNLKLDPVGVDKALKGMHASANAHYGTAHQIPALKNEKIFNLSGVTILAKSGTAAARHRIRDLNRDGKLNPGEHRWVDFNRSDRIEAGERVASGDHAWCIVLTEAPGTRRKEFAVVVVVEYAGSGGMVAGPIANQILYALRAEGYL